MDTSDEFALERHRMVVGQLQARGIESPRVLAAMEKVPREHFVPLSCRHLAYADRALAIDCGQTISQPYIVALMTEALELEGDETVLEIGTGSGYQAAVLAELARKVITIERHPQLASQARQRLAELGYTNVECLVGDGSLGWPAEAPYPRIIITAAALECPPALFEQLEEGGILVAPLGDDDYQTLEAIRKIGGRPRARPLSSCRFVPLIGAAGWAPEVENS